MSVSGPIPRALRLVAFLFLYNGISAVITILVSVLNNRLQLDFSVIGIFVCIGLLQLSDGWRRCAIVLTLLGIIMIPVVGILSLSAPHANINFLGIIGPEIPARYRLFYLPLLVWSGFMAVECARSA